MDDSSRWQKSVLPIVGWLILLIVLLSVVGIVYLTLVKRPVKTAQYPYGNTNGLVAPLTSSAPDLSNLPMTDEGVTWLSDFEKLGDLNLLTLPKPNKDGYYDGGVLKFNGVTYQKIGSDNGKDLILAILSLDYDGPGGEGSTELFHFLKNSNDSYTFLKKHSTERFDGTEGAVFPSHVTFTSKVTNESDRIYNTIAYRKTITANGITFISTNDMNGANVGTLYAPTPKDSKNGATEEQIAVLPIGTLYREILPQDDGYNIETIALRRLNGTDIMYSLPVGFVDDGYGVSVTWNDGTKNQDQYRFDGIPRGCGHPYGSAILKNVSDADLVASGKGKNGEIVYDFKGTDNPVFKTAYQAYADFFTSQQASYKTYPPTTEWDIEMANTKLLTIDQFREKHGVIVFKDKLGRYNFLTSMKYGVQAECGKPVIYLYPEQPTNVSVAVGADVKVSEPAYGTGWSVTADPSGKLTVNGKSYDSLYWEGLGKGKYPVITEGTVVPQADVVKTIRQQLGQQGLNEKETADFLEFWTPRLPKTPYVRLTWFGTKQLDELAPLTVSPKPATVIRTFLDFEGLERPMAIKPQHLSAMPRHGFTLVEWGGLLH